MRDLRGIVAIILAASIGLAIVLSLAWTLGPWTPVPEEAIAMEVLALLAAGLGALSVYIGMSVAGRSEQEEAPLMQDDDDTPEDDPEAWDETEPEETRP